MNGGDITFRILRYAPGRIDPPQYRDYAVRAEPGMTVLDGLERIRLTLDRTLMYRHCCHHASCGTCACTINGTPALACTARISDLGTDTVTLAPLANAHCIGDLAVDTASFFHDLPAGWANVRVCEKSSEKHTPKGVEHYQRLENCIECGCCVADCPVAGSDEGFLGPAVLAALNNEIRNRPTDRQALLQKAASPRGVGLCRRHLACSRVCPSKVYPARHITDLKRATDPAVKK